jgi:hypothetical protein
MASLLSPSSRSIQQNGFLPDLPANSGDTEVVFNLGAPYGVKQEKTFTNERPDGSTFETRKVRYSVMTTDRKHVAWLELRRSDFAAGGVFGDNSIELLLDAKLKQATDTGDNVERFPVKASFDYVDKHGNKCSGRDGVVFLR